jgi:type II secretory pathway pseudopilin PulG
MNIKMQIIKEKQQGFTIIELVVVIAVFMFVIGAAVGIFLSVVQSQRKILSEAEFLNQIGYAEEYMSKALRMATMAEDDSCIPQGYIYSLTRYNQSAGLFRGIKFLNQSDTDSTGNPACQEFFLDDADPFHPVLKEIKNDSNAVAITSSNLQISSAKFSVNGSNGSTFISPNGGCPSTTVCGATNLDIIQPRATILLNIIIPSGGTRTIQTTVSQRNLNVQ